MFDIYELKQHTGFAKVAFQISIAV